MPNEKTDEKTNEYSCFRSIGKMICNPGFILVLLFIAISIMVLAICWVVAHILPPIIDINNYNKNNGLFVVILTILFIYFVGTPIILDIVGSYAFEFCRLELVPGEKRCKLIHETKDIELSGVRNLTRAMIALSIILIIGVAVGFLMLNMYNLSNDFYEITKNITSANIQHEKDMDRLGNILSNTLAILAGAVAAITGFFFGSRTQEKTGNLQDSSEPRIQKKTGKPPTSSGSDNEGKESEINKPNG
jgi:hypothetical protein